MLNPSSYFEGQVQSVGFARHGRRQTVGVIAPGSYHFGIEAAERMTVVSGALRICLDGSAEWQLYAQGSSFEVAAHSGFSVEAMECAAYWCEYL
ncbi:MAG: pyrimidine/purine nucleoside phosphorylase [Planctomycetota bacterium]|nr:MAG: pyrimidine/purine nucleoside phosphorylase [Planctomycetota bacterium]